MNRTADSPLTDRSAPPESDASPALRDVAADVVFIGALPPPITGMTAMTAVIVEALKQHGSLTCFNWSRGKPLRGWRWRVARMWGAVRSLIGLALRGRTRSAVLYYPVSSGIGLYSDLAIVSMARLLGYRPVLHHHSYAYFDKRDWRVGVLNRLVGNDGAHAVHCALMQRDFLSQYASQADFLFVPPTIVSQRLEACADQRSGDKFVLGFLSNLSLAKGIDDVIATFERLARSGENVRLLLAGPCMASTERMMIDKAIAQWPERIEYRGPVYGRDKARFYADIDAFLFPTRTESWGIVLTESLSVGCPVITRSRGCTPWIVRDGCGLVIEDGVDFPTAAADQVRTWLADPARFQETRTAAKLRSAALEQDATEQLPAFVDRVRFG